MKHLMAVVVGGALVLAGSTATLLDAATTTTFPVTATAAATCTVSATGVSFGTYTGGVLFANGSLNVNCSSGTPYNVALNAGGNYNGAARQMINGAAAIAYGIYRDAGFNTQWGDNGCGAGNTYSAGTCQAGTGSGVAQALTAYGVAFAGQSTVPGSYSDTVVATVVF